MKDFFRKNMKNISPYLFIAPFFMLFIVFFLYPIFYSLVLSFSKWTSGGLEFVGIQNYLYLLTDPVFWKSLVNTGQILVIQVPIMLLLACIVAVLINSKHTKYKALFRLGFFVPVIIDLVTYSLVFSLMFNERYGIINQFLTSIGIEGIPWFSNGIWAKVMIAIAMTWRWTGYNSIIILSGLQSIPGTIYEAATIDGANKIDTFFKITIPMLKPVLLFCMILSTIGTLQLFTEPYMLTKGGPNNETLTAIYYIYDRAFGSFKFGLASAGAYIVTTIIGILSYIQLKVSDGGEI